MSEQIKVVINSCYGGFSLSNEACREYLRRSGKQWTERPLFPNAAYVVGEPGWYDRDLDRTDPLLVTLVEEMGDAANGDCASLEVKTLPKGTRYRIGEYDGTEWIETRDGIDWSIA